jgi:hypothetical protein
MRRLLLSTTVLALSGGFVLSGDLSGRAILSWQQFDGHTFTTDGFHQTYDARWERQVTTPFRLRLSLRAEEDDGGRDAGFGRASRSFSQLQPGAELLYTLPRFELQGTFDRIRTSGTSESGVTSERTLERNVGRASWRPDGLPAFTLLAESRGSEDPGIALNRVEKLLQGTVDYNWRGLVATAMARHTTLDDGQENFARESDERQGLLGYDGTFFRGRLTTSANVLLSSNALDERATGGATTSLRPLTVTRASHSLDDTPTDDRDAAPRQVGTLIDGELDRPSGISVGPEDRSYQNVAMDFGRAAAVGTARVIVRDAAGRPVPFGGAVRWDVYVSQDGSAWNLLPALATTTFVAAPSYYEVRFAQVTTRFLKLVSFGANTVDTRLTEVQAFERVELAAGELRHTDILLGNVVLSVNARPVERVLLSYDGLLNDLRQESDDRPETTSRGMDHFLSGEVDPWRVLGFVARYQRRGLTQTAGYSQDYEAWTGIVRLRPLDGLEQSVEYTRSTEDNAGIRSTGTTLVLHVFARPYEALDVTLDAGRNQQQYALANGEVERTFVSGTANAQLTRNLRLLLGASFSNSDYGRGEAPVDPNVGLPAQKDERIAAEAYYRASVQLAVSVRVGWADTGDVSGLLQRYHLDWYPFPGGALRIGAQYDQDIDGLTGRQARRFSFTPAWQVNRRMILNFNYTNTDVPSDPAAGTRTLSTTLTVTL